MSQPLKPIPHTRVRLVPTTGEDGKPRVIRDPDRDFQIVPPTGVVVSKKSKNFPTFWLRRVKAGEMTIAPEPEAARASEE